MSNNMLRDFIESFNNANGEDSFNDFICSIFGVEPESLNKDVNKDVKHPAPKKEVNEDKNEKVEFESDKTKSGFPMLTIKNGHVTTNTKSYGINHIIEIYCKFNREQHFPCSDEYVRRMLEYPVRVWEDYIYDRKMDENDTDVTENSTVGLEFHISSEEYPEEMVIYGNYEHDIDGFVMCFNNKLYYINADKHFEYICDIEDPDKAEEEPKKVDPKPIEYKGNDDYVCFKGCCYCKDCDFYKECMLGEVDVEIDWNGLFE